MEENRHFIHLLLFIIGLVLFSYSTVTALVLHNSHFYTGFALGSWLLLDFIDYKINKTSILTYFLNYRHFDALKLFLIISTVGCFVVDFILGVSITGMWKWRTYGPLNFVLMFLFMNVSFIFSMYELYRLYETIFRDRVSTEHLLKFRVKRSIRLSAPYVFILTGIIFIVVPFYPLWLKDTRFVEFAMLLPFIGLVLISDAFTIYLGGKSFVNEILRFNLNIVFTVIFTVFTGALITELINLSALEWSYEKMPFVQLKFLNIPLAVFVGWTPLVISTISMVNLVKRYSYVKNNFQKR